MAVALEGRRPLLSEVQALVTHTPAERPRRTTSGVDSARVAMILAVLQQHAGIRLHNHDVFVSSVGGARLTEPSNDVAIALAITSAWMGKPLGRNVVAIGELGLSGELRRVRDVGVRLAEAGRMGFRSALIPAVAAETAGQQPGPRRHAGRRRRQHRARTEPAGAGEESDNGQRRQACS